MQRGQRHPDDLWRLANRHPRTTSWSVSTVTISAILVVMAFICIQLPRREQVTIRVSFGTEVVPEAPVTITAPESPEPEPETDVEQQKVAEPETEAPEPEDVQGPDTPKRWKINVRPKATRPTVHRLKKARQVVRMLTRKRWFPRHEAACSAMVENAASLR